MNINPKANSGDPSIGSKRFRRTGLAVKSIKTAIITAILAGAAAFATASPASADIIRIQQVSSGRYLDAWETNTYDYRVVIWSHQDNDTQLWRRTHVAGNIYTLQQVSNDRYMDAHQNDANDWNVVTRPNQNNDTQRWIMTDLGGGIFTIQQLSSGRYLDAWQSDAQGWRVVTRPWQGNDTQRWRVTVQLELVPLPLPPLPLPPVIPPEHSAGTFQWSPPFPADFDTGTLGAAGADLNYFAPDLINMQMIPTNGAQISFTDGTQRGYLGCSTAAYSGVPVLLSAIPVGGYVCLRTSDGRYSEFRVNSVGPILKILSVTYTTWQ